MMKRLSILVGIACMLVTAASAMAATRKYSGPIAPSGTLSFNLKSANGQKEILKLSWEDLPVNCAGGPNVSSGGLSFAVPLIKKGFKARAVLGNPDNPRAEAKIDGRVTARKASGTISLQGSKLPIPGGADDCQSGKLTWTATR